MMKMYWPWVTHRKERKELEQALKPATAQERRALRQFSNAVSNLLLKETSIRTRGHSLAELEEKLLGASWPAKQKGVQVRVNFSLYVPPGLKLDDRLFPALATVALISGARDFDRDMMFLQADYNPNTGRFRLEIPAMVPLSVSGSSLVKSAVKELSGSIALTPFNHTVLTVRAERE